MINSVQGIHHERNLFNVVQTFLAVIDYTFEYNPPLP